MLTTTEGVKLQVWPGCLHCYNAGKLVGAWIDASEAGELTIQRLHELAGAPLTAFCEEIECLDLDSFPVSREMGLQEAKEWADAYAEVPEHQQQALSAWVESGAYVALGNGDVPSTSDFLEHYQGEWDSWSEFVDQWLEDVDYFDHWPETAKTYFDQEKFGRDLAFDFTVMDAPGGGVFVFSNP